MLLIFATSQICGLVSSRVVFNNEEANGRKEKHKFAIALDYHIQFPGFTDTQRFSNG